MADRANSRPLVAIVEGQHRDVVPLWVQGRFAGAVQDHAGQSKDHDGQFLGNGSSQFGTTGGAMTRLFRNRGLVWSAAKSWMGNHYWSQWEINYAMALSFRQPSVVGVANNGKFGLEVP